MEYQISGGMGLQAGSGGALRGTTRSTLSLYYGYNKLTAEELRFSWNIPGRASALVQIFLDALRLAEQEGCVLLGKLSELFERLHGLFEFFGKFGVLLIGPRIAQRDKAGVQQNHAVLNFAVEALQFLREPPHLFGIHDGLRHNYFECCAAGKMPHPAA
jgi:hypothetical protein